MTATGTPDIEIQKSASESVARSGDVITYSLTLRVTGNTAHLVQVADQMPGHLIYAGTGAVPAGGTSAWDPASKTLTWSWAYLAPGTYSLAYQADVDFYVTEGTLITNCASVNYDGLAAPRTACASTSMASLYTVHVGVYNEAGELVKDIWVQQLSSQVQDFNLSDDATITSVHGSVTVEFQGKPIAVWDGTNQTGDPVTNGKYYLKVDNVDGFGVVTSTAKMVMVSRSVAKVQVNVFNESGEIVRHLYSYVDDPGGNLLADIQLSTTVIKTSALASSNGSVNITSSNGMSLVWDGKSDSGSLVTNGRYEVEIHITDGKGGEQVVSRGIIVESDNQSLTNGKVAAKPNILSGGNTLATLWVDSTTPFTLSAQLYNVAGERLGPAWQGKTGGKQVDVDLEGMASGLYFAIVDLRDPQGGLAAKQVTQIVLRK